MKIHPTSIEGFDTLQDAAITVGKMRYDALAAFLGYLHEELHRQQEEDDKVGKTQLAYDVDYILDDIYGAHSAMEDLFKKYKRFMEKELAITGEIKYHTPHEREQIKDD